MRRGGGGTAQSRPTTRALLLFAFRSAPDFAPLALRAPPPLEVVSRPPNGAEEVALILRDRSTRRRKSAPKSKAQSQNRRATMRAREQSKSIRRGGLRANSINCGSRRLSATGAAARRLIKLDYLVVSVRPQRGPCTLRRRTGRGRVRRETQMKNDARPLAPTRRPLRGAQTLRAPAEAQPENKGPLCRRRCSGGALREHFSGCRLFRRRRRN